MSVCSAGSSAPCSSRRPRRPPVSLPAPGAAPGRRSPGPGPGCGARRSQEAGRCPRAELSCHQAPPVFEERNLGSCVHAFRNRQSGLSDGCVKTWWWFWLVESRRCTPLPKENGVETLNCLGDVANVSIWIGNLFVYCQATSSWSLYEMTYPIFLLNTRL